MAAHAALGPVADSLASLCYRGDAAAVARLLDAAPSPDAQATIISARDGDGRNLLHWAASGGHVELAAELMRRVGGELGSGLANARDAAGFTPLTSAVAAGRAACVALLLANGADANVPTVNGQRPLHFHKGRTNVIASLLPFVEDVDSRDATGSTALHRAAGPGFHEAAAALLAAGAAVNAVSRCACQPCVEARAASSCVLVPNC